MMRSGTVLLYFLGALTTLCTTWDEAKERPVGITVVGMVIWPAVPVLFVVSAALKAKADAAAGKAAE